MAIIKQTGTPDILISNIHGKLGGLVFRQRNGKTIISQRPASFKPSQKPECVASRNKFGTIVKFASFLGRIPVINQLWQEAQLTGTISRNRLIKYNYAMTAENLPTIHNIITPPGHHFKLLDAVISGGKIRLKADKKYKPGKNDILLVIMAAYDPATPQDELFVMSDLSADYNKNLTLDMDFTYAGRYNKFILYCAIVKHIGSKLMWSKTIARAGEFADKVNR